MVTREPNIKSVCGVKVLTWDTHPDAGNGMMHFLDAQFFGGNTGHAAIMLTFPADEEGKELIEKYCKVHKIPYRKKTIDVAKAELNKNGKFAKGKTSAFKEEVYEVYWSWWPQAGEGVASEPGKYELMADFSKDTLSERRGVPFHWDPKWADYIRPEERYHKGTLGGRAVSYGPREVIHERELQAKDIKYFDGQSKLNDAIEKMEALDFLTRRLDEKKDQFTEDKNAIITYQDLSGSEKLMLSRFFPEWRKSMKTKPNITEKDFEDLALQIQTKRTYYEAIVNLYQYEGIKNLINYLNSSKKDIPISVLKIPKAYLEVLAQSLGLQKWDDVIKNAKNLDPEINIHELYEDDIKLLLEASHQQISKLKENKMVSNTLDGENLLTVMKYIQKIHKNDDPEKQKVLYKGLFKKLKTLELESLKDFLPPDKTWSDVEVEKFGTAELNKLLRLVLSEYDKMKDNVISDFSRGSLYKTSNKKALDYISEGKPPEGIVFLPIKPLAHSNIGQSDGLDVELMLKKMVELSAPDAEGFHLYNKNCSKTTDSILEAGANDAQKEFFRGKAFGFFGNPQECFNNASNFRAMIDQGEKGTLAKVLDFNPLERAGGFLFDKVMANKMPESGKVKTLVWFGKEASLYVGLTLVGSLSLIANPLKSVQGGTGLIKYSMGKKSLPLIVFSTLFVAPIVIILSPFALLQWGGKKMIAPLIKPQKSKPKKVVSKEKSKRQGEEVILEDDSGLKQRTEQNMAEMAERKGLDEFVSAGYKRNIIEVDVEKDKSISEKAIDALREFRRILKDPSEKQSIPVFSNESAKAIQAFIQSGESLPPDLEIVNKEGKSLSSRELYQQFCKESLDRTMSYQKILLMKRPSKNELILKSILMSKFEIAQEKSDVVNFSSSKTLPKELKFINKLKKLLRKDDTLAGAPGIQKKAQYLWTAMDLVIGHLQAEKRITPKEQQTLETEMQKLQGLIDKSAPSLQSADLETYLGEYAKSGGNRVLVERCHELIIEEKLRNPSIPGPQYLGKI